jgi:hypothetical protein
VSEACLFVLLTLAVSPQCINSPEDLTCRSAAYRTALHGPLLAANHDQANISEFFHGDGDKQVIAWEDARDGTLRPRFMIGRYSRCTAWYGTPLHGPLLAAKHDQTSFQHSQDTHQSI